MYFIHLLNLDIGSFLMKSFRLAMYVVCSTSVPDFMFVSVGAEMSWL